MTKGVPHEVLSNCFNELVDRLPFGAQDDAEKVLGYASRRIEELEGIITKARNTAWACERFRECDCLGFNDECACKVLYERCHCAECSPRC